MRKTITTITDDIDGSPDAETHTISIDGYTIDIDLAPANRSRLYDLLRPYLDNGRRATPAADATPALGPERRPPGWGPIRSDIRLWWKRHPQGLPTWQARGAIPAAVANAWQTRRGADT